MGTELRADVNDTLKTIRSIGYKEVEGTGFAGLSESSFVQPWIVQTENIPGFSFGRFRHAIGMELFQMVWNAYGHR